MANEPQLQSGESGEWVQYLQQLLENAGYSPGEADGEFGPNTEEAVRSFQAASGLSADGVVGPDVWARLTGEDSGAGDGDVPAEFVQAGAPASLSAWSDDQKTAYFQGQASEDVGGESPEQLEVAAISTDGDEGSWA